MTEITANSNRLSQWLFNPFRFIAGFKALLLGLVIILLSAFVGSLSNTHFDGVLDIHSGLEAPLWFFFAEVLIDWIYVVVPLFFFGLIVSRSAFRIIDVLGTQALARWPYLIAAIVMLPDANQRVLTYLMSKLTQAASTSAVSSIDVLVFVFAMIVIILMVIWTVALTYQAYTVSCNIRGASAIITFVVSLIGAEVLSKIAILRLVSFFS